MSSHATLNAGVSARAFGFVLIAFLAACASDTVGLDAGPTPDSGTGPTGCTSAAECAPEEQCSNRACIPIPDNVCTRDEDCGSDQTCHVVTDCGDPICGGNSCAPKACAGDEDCASGDCTDGACVPRTSCATSPCPDGFTCVMDECVPNGCERDSECEGERICILGACTDRTDCTTSSECTGGLRCQMGVCREACAADEDCGSPAVAWQCSAGECQRRCIGDGTCPGGMICRSRICEASECSENADCGSPSLRCAGGPDHGRCEEFTPCTQGGNECPPNFLCENEACVELPTCISDRSCDATSYCEEAHCQPSTGCTGSCSSGLECVAGRCVPAVCRSNAACGAELCIGGVCGSAPSPATVIDVRILTPAGYVRPGTTYAFRAVALDPAGNVVPGVTFNWRSTTVEVATIDATGLATGGDIAGETFITASMNNGTSVVTSVPVSLVNLGLQDGSFRISVIDLASGSPVQGARVVVGTNEATTDAVGSAVMNGVTFPANVTVAHATHDWVTLMSVGSAAAPSVDLVVPLPAISRDDRIAGLKGTVDFSAVTETGPLSASLSGASFASPLFAFFEPGQIFGGDQFTVTVNPPGGGSGFSFPVAANATLAADVLGTPITLKDTFYARSRPGTRSAWCFAGRLGDAGFSDALRQLADGPAGLLPFLQNFRHAVRPFQPTLALPTVVDTQDVDGDADTSELVPDYAAFPSLSFRPTAEQNLRYELRASGAPLPFVFGGIADTIILMSGVVLPGTGFVPLGFDGYRDETRTGLAPDLFSRMAPPHGGLESGQIAVIAVAVRTEGRSIPGPGAAQLHVYDSLPSVVDVSAGWISSPSGGTVAGRTIRQPRVDGADFLHATLFAGDGAWHVYWPAELEELTIPPAPSGFNDRVGTGTVALDAVDVDGQPTLSQLFDVSRSNSLDLDRATRRFSRALLSR
ncbi:MAG: hypothetical protein HYV07_23110 [Deltaproteobacteria bacterium]|nr:hypothetical protein [Deltaproteobacteria bacterium]